MGNPYAKEVKFLFLAQLLLFLGILFKGKTAGGFLCLALGFSVPIFVVAIMSLCRSKHSEGRKGKTSGVVGILLELPVIATIIWVSRDPELIMYVPAILEMVSPSVLVFGITWAIRRNMQQSKQEQHDDTIPDGEKPETLDARTGRKLSLPVVVIITGVILMAGSVVFYVLGDNNSNAVANTDIDSNTTTLSDPSFSYTAETYFTNKYGTATTICAHSGCTNYIASSGDTNCCITHSNKCLECGCYIDEDAAWCVSCITRAAKQAKNNSVHYCEECGKEAAYSIIGITGAKEYYCYTHYKEMQEIMEWLTKN